MTQALQTKDGFLLQGLSIQNAYTQLRQGSKNVVIVVRNSMTYPQTLQKKTPVAMETSLPEGKDGPQNPHTPKLTVRHRQGKLFEALDLGGWTHGLQSWQMLPAGF